MKRGSKRQISMDNFIVRSPKKSPVPSLTKGRGGLRQATLESLRGVVVVEDMERAVVVLERPDVSLELKVDTLQHLLSKNPAKEVLIRTGLGKTVHKLCRSEDAEVAVAAQRVYRAWKKHILSKVNRPCIEVKCDLTTQRLRNSARQMLHDALQRKDGKDGGGEEVGDSKGRRKTSEAEDQEKDWTINEGFNMEKRTYIQEEEKERKGRSEEIKDHKRTGDSDKKSKKQKQNGKEEEGGAGKTKSRQRHEEEEMEENEREIRKTGEEKSQKQKDEEEGGEGWRNKKGKRQEREIQEEEERKGREKCEVKNSGPTNKNSENDHSKKHNSLELLAEHIEREVYHSSQRRVDNSYRRTVRALVFTLRHQGKVRKTVSSFALSVPDFVHKCKKS